MTALPLAPSANAVHDAVQRLGAIQPGPYRVVSCYLKLEPRDKTRGKYLIKMKNRIREAVAALERQSLERAVRDQVAADLERIRRYFEEPGELPRSRAVTASTIITCGSARKSTGITPTSPTASTRSTPSGRWSAWSWRASA